MPLGKLFFGSLDLCDCQHCQSLYSPSAYFVDLLQFIKQTGDKLFEVLKVRRPDLLHIKLTCENATTPLPYIDLINEILEYYVGYGGVLAADAAHDTGDLTPDELIANPQYTVERAYESLREAKYAPNLPFNRNVEVARTYLEHLGSSRYEVMNLFRDKNPATFIAGQRAVDAEFIKMTEEEYRLLTRKNFDGKNVSSPIQLYELYGYRPKTLPSAKLLPELKKSGSGSFVIVLQRLLNITEPDPLLVVDGQFGDKTEEAVNTFQESHGLIKTGIVNAQTWKNLKSVQPALWKLFVTQVPEFLNRMAIGYEELLELLNTRFINPDRDLSAFMQQNHLDWRKLEGIINYVEVNPECPEPLGMIAQWGLANREKTRQYIVLNTPSSSQCNLSVTLIQHPDGSDINDFELAKLVLFIRLWRKLGWSITEVDQSFTALSANNIPNLLQKLSWVQQLNADLNLPLMQIFSLWADIETIGDPSLYSQLFLNKAAQEIDPAFQPNSLDGSILTDDSEELANHISTLLSAFRISETDLELIRIDAKLTAPKTVLTLANVSQLYRYVVLAKALRIPIKDLIDFKTLSGINPFTGPARTLKFVAIVGKVRDSEFSLAQSNYLYRHIVVVPGSFGPQHVSLLLLAKKLRDGLAQISSENQLVDDPNGEITRSKIAQFFEPEVADRLVQFVKDATVSHKASLDVLTALKFPEEIAQQFTSLSVEEINQRIEIVKPSIIQVYIKNIIEIIRKTDVSNKISYHPTDKCLIFTGYLTEQAKLSLLNGADSMRPVEEYLRDLLERTTLIGELTNPELKLLIDSYQTSIINEYQRAINTLYDLSQQNILPIIREASIFIAKSLDAVLHPGKTIDCLIRYSSVAEVFTDILQQLLQYLRDLLSRRLIKQTLGEALKLDSEVTELLLEKLLKSPLEPKKPAIHAALALKTQGLGATYFSTPDLTGEPLAFQTDLAIAFDGEKTFLVEGTHSVRWRGWLQVPDNGDYTFSIRTNGKVKLCLGETPGLIINNTDSPSNSLGEISSTAIPLKVGQLYYLRLELSQLPDPVPSADPAIAPMAPIAPIAEFFWSKGTAEKSIISSEDFYPGWCLDRFIATYSLLDKVAQLIGGFKLTAKEVNYLTSHASDFNNLTLQAFPLHRLTPKIVDGWAKTLFKQWQRLHDFVTLRNSLPQGEVSLIDVFVQASATNADLNDLREKLNQASGWDAPSLQYVVGASGFDLKPTNFRHEIWISYLKSCLALSKRLGVSVQKLFAWSQGVSGFAQDIKDTVKAKYDDQTWLTIAKPLNDVLRESQKAALIAYILTMPSIRNQGITNSNQLFEYFLIDVEMTACMKTSRLKQAIASVQLFIQRCLMNLEPGVSPESIDDEQWEWRKRYRVWEANRKIFLYPENWIYPELRDDKSPFFKELESELLQNDLTELNVEKALLHYLEKLDKVSRLKNL